MKKPQLILFGLCGVALLVTLFLRYPSSRLGSRVGNPSGGKLIRTDAEWRGELTAEQYHVTREQGTEQPYANAYWNTKTNGVYLCVCCGQPLFDSSAKYDSGTGWPSFWQPIHEDNVTLKTEDRMAGARTEVICSRCDAHLGHVFGDGPLPTGMRYCMNSAALKLQPR